MTARGLSTVAILPAFNEAATVADVAAAVRRYVDHVVVVDDGSSDATAAVVGRLDVSLVRHGGNRGKGAALRSGFRRAMELRPSWLVTVDADGQHATEAIPELLACARRHPDRVIIGERRGKAAKAPWLRRAANAIADLSIACAAGRRLPDTQSGFRVYPAEPVFALLPALQADRFAFEAELLIELCRQGIAVESVAIPARYTGQARSSHYRAVGDTLRIMATVARKLAAWGLRPMQRLRARRSG